MNRNLDWLGGLKNKRKGIWGIECPSGINFSINNLLDFLQSGDETKTINIYSNEHGARFQDLNQNWRDLKDFRLVADQFQKEAKENGRTFVRVAFDAFENASIKEQCGLLKTARSIQESQGALAWQFVFCGRWSHYVLRPAYREIHGQTTSPPTDSKNAIQVPFWSDSEVFDLLQERRLIAARATELDVIACDFLVEQTAGDEFLIRHAIDRLGSGDWIDNIEQVLWELISAPDVIDGIAGRVRLLGSRSREELIKLLRVHNLIRDFEEVEAEELWLAGLVRRTKLPGGKQVLRIAGPIINAVVRNFLSDESPENIAVPKHICFEREAIAVAAYRRVAQLENLLRNVIASEWSIKFGDKWCEKLKATKTSSRYGEETEELIHRILINNYGISPQENNPDALSDERNSKRKQTTIFASATDWQKRQRENHALELHQDNLMHFLTTESLISVLENTKNDFCGDGKPFKREFLLSALAEYTGIRSAVAHNQPIKLATIRKLDELNRQFQHWLSVFADSSNCVGPTPP